MDPILLEQVLRGTATTESLAAVGLSIQAAAEQAKSERYSLVRPTKAQPLDAREAHALRAKGVNTDRVLTYLATDETVNRYGDIVRIAGIDLTAYENAPVVLLMHANTPDVLGQLPVARAVAARKGKSEAGVKALYLDVEFAAALAHPYAEVAFQLSSSGFMPSGSISFDPREVRYISDESERTKLGLGPFGVVIEKSELIEFSLVNVGANRNAVRQSLRDLVEAGSLTADQAEQGERLAFVPAQLGAPQPQRIEVHSAPETGLVLGAVATLIERQTEQMAAIVQLSDAVTTLSRVAVDLSARAVALQAPSSGRAEGRSEPKPVEQADPKLAAEADVLAAIHSLTEQLRLKRSA